ncbi:helix-turn-helix domain-containing protein [Acinetobacter guillouiae]|uniref:helix-turn-helix domain-containing protein n=1 Tax=Acinetobacter guillouiae TaxID=106649 RepID=UPI003AF4B570
MQINTDNLQSKSIIKFVRKEYYKENQKDFAKRVGSKQSLISKYENGFVSPPSELLIQCMNIYMRKKAIQEESLTKGVSTNILVGLVESLLGGDDQEQQRRIVANLIKIISNT